MKRVLVTGALGFLGQATLPFLLHSGYEVHTVSRNTAPVRNDVTHHFADLLDKEQVNRLFAQIKPTHFLHFAWETRHRLSYPSPDNLDWLGASCHMLRAFADNGGKRAVSSGTCSEYDLSYGYLHEDTPINLDSPYSACKRSFFQTAVAFSQTAGFSYASGRIFYLYGPGDKPQKAVAYAVDGLLKGQSVTCNSANTIRDYMFIEDCAEGFVKLLDSELTGGVNIASGEPTRMGDIFLNIADMLGRRDLLTLNNVSFGEPKDILTQPAGDPVILADITKMTKELGYYPSNTIEEGLAKTIAWHRERI